MDRGMAGICNHEHLFKAAGVSRCFYFFFFLKTKTNKEVDSHMRKLRMNASKEHQIEKWIEEARSQWETADLNKGINKIPLGDESIVSHLKMSIDSLSNYSLLNTITHQSYLHDRALIMSKENREYRFVIWYVLIQEALDRMN